VLKYFRPPQHLLEVDYTSGCASPAFVIAKQNGSIRVISGSRKLHSVLKHYPFSLPSFGDMIASMERFTFATALDLYMG
jgi:hypothetical protein